MRTLTHIQELVGPAGDTDRISHAYELRYEYSMVAGATRDSAGCGVRYSSVGRAARVVGLMAFAQSLIFLVIWLLVCANAGAAPAKKVEVSTDLTLSTYEPTKTRSPLTKAGLAMGDGKSEGGPVAMQLEGILYEASNPSAIVNGRMLTLNKTVTVGTPGGATVQMRAIEITRDKAVIEVGGQKIELHLNKPDAVGHR